MNVKIIKMSDTIGKMQAYAYLVPERYKNYYPQMKRFGFNLEGLKLLRDHPFVSEDLRAYLKNFICAVE